MGFIFWGTVWQNEFLLLCFYYTVGTRRDPSHHLALALILSHSNDPGTILSLGVGLRSDTGLRPSLFLRPDDGPLARPGADLCPSGGPCLFPRPVVDPRPNADPGPCTRPGADSLNQ